MYGSWDIECDRYNFLSFWAISYPFTPPPPNNPENQNFVKIKNTWRYHHFTKVYLKWQSYNIWFQWYEVQQDFFCHFGPYFCPFTPLTNQKIKMLKKWRKKHLEISSFYTNVTKILIILYCSWDMVHDGFNSYFSFWAIFWPLTPLTAQKLKISQKWKKKNTWRYHHFTKVYQKSWSYAILFLRYDMWWDVIAIFLFRTLGTHGM